MAGNFYASYPVSSGGGGVTSLNSETGDVTLVEGANITITPLGQDITIAAPNSNTIVKYSKTYTDFAIANTTNTLSLPAVPAGYFLDSAVIDITEAFSGGGESFVSVSSAVNSLGTGSADGTTVTITAQSGIAFISHSSGANTITLLSDVNLDTLITGAIDLYYILVKVF